MDDSSVGGGKLECREKDDQHLSFFKQGFNVLNLTISESYGEKLASSDWGDQLCWKSRDRRWLKLQASCTHYQGDYWIQNDGHNVTENDSSITLLF